MKLKYYNNWLFLHFESSIYLLFLENYNNLTTINCILSSVYKKDKYFILKNNVNICIKKIIKKAHGNIYFVVKYNTVSFFDNPLVSDIIGDFYVDILNETDSLIINMNNIKYKCLFMFIDHENIKTIILYFILIFFLYIRIGN
jgi:hypothetical protein